MNARSARLRLLDRGDELRQLLLVQGFFDPREEPGLLEADVVVEEVAERVQLADGATLPAMSGMYPVVTAAAPTPSPWRSPGSLR